MQLSTSKLSKTTTRLSRDTIPHYYYLATVATIMLNFILVLLFTLDFMFAWVLLGFLAMPVIFLIRPVSLSMSRRVSECIFGFWLYLIVWVIETFGRVRIVLSGNHDLNTKRVLVVCNHRTELDWMFLWSYAIHNNHIGNVKYFLKNSLTKLPLLGWAFHVMEFIPLKRNWDQDGETIQNRLKTWKNREESIWLTLFPEGTDFREKKKIKSQEFSRSNNLPIFENTLVPKIKGFMAAMGEIGGTIDGVCDLTIGYFPRDPTFSDFLWGKENIEVNIFCDFLKPQKIPKSHAMLKNWMMEKFQEKDKMLQNFYKTGTFLEFRGDQKLDFVTGLLSHFFVLFVVLSSTISLIWGPPWVFLYFTTSNILLSTITFLSWLPPSLFP